MFGGFFCLISTRLELQNPPSNIDYLNVCYILGIGLSPGDKNYDEPYWYLSPYPYPETEKLPPLDGNGFWHTQHWVGAVLRASQLSKNGTAEAQQKQVKSFLDSALQAGKLLLKG